LDLNIYIKKIQNELSDFIIERLKNYLKEKKIRQDIIESSTFLLGLDDLLKAYKKSLCLNKNIKKDQELIHTLMGNDVTLRKDFIISNAINVQNLDFFKFFFIGLFNRNDL